MPAAAPFNPQDIVDANYTERPLKPGVTTKRTICQSCDIACSVVPEVKKGRVVKVRSSDNPIFRDNICMKAIVAPKGLAHPNRLLHPLKRVGERGSGEWEQDFLRDELIDNDEGFDPDELDRYQRGE
jgi:anaerobic selenocysteine-containing dehydrogenase